MSSGSGGEPPPPPRPPGSPVPPPPGFSPDSWHQQEVRMRMRNPLAGMRPSFPAPYPYTDVHNSQNYAHPRQVLHSSQNNVLPNPVAFQGAVNPNQLYFQQQVQQFCAEQHSSQNFAATDLSQHQQPVLRSPPPVQHLHVQPGGYPTTQVSPSESFEMESPRTEPRPGSYRQVPPKRCFHSVTQSLCPPPVTGNHKWNVEFKLSLCSDCTMCSNMLVTCLGLQSDMACHGGQDKVSLRSTETGPEGDDRTLNILLPMLGAYRYSQYQERYQEEHEAYFRHRNQHPSQVSPQSQTSGNLSEGQPSRQSSAQQMVPPQQSWLSSGQPWQQSAPQMVPSQQPAAVPRQQSATQIVPSQLSSAPQMTAPRPQQTATQVVAPSSQSQRSAQQAVASSSQRPAQQAVASSSQSSAKQKTANPGVKSASVTPGINQRLQMLSQSGAPAGSASYASATKKQQPNKSTKFSASARSGDNSASTSRSSRRDADPDRKRPRSSSGGNVGPNRPARPQSQGRAPRPGPRGLHDYTSFCLQREQIDEDLLHSYGTAFSLSLRVTSRLYRNSDPADTPRNWCPLCSRLIAGMTPYLMRFHLIQHHGVPEYCCPSNTLPCCGAIFSSKSYARRHLTDYPQHDEFMMSGPQVKERNIQLTNDYINWLVEMAVRWGLFSRTANNSDVECIATMGRFFLNPKYYRMIFYNPFYNGVTSNIDSELHAHDQSIAEAGGESEWWDRCNDPLLWDIPYERAAVYRLYMQYNARVDSRYHISLAMAILFYDFRFIAMSLALRPPRSRQELNPEIEPYARMLPAADANRFYVCKLSDVPDRHRHEVASARLIQANANPGNIVREPEDVVMASPLKPAKADRSGASSSPKVAAPEESAASCSATVQRSAEPSFSFASRDCRPEYRDLDNRVNKPSPSISNVEPPALSDSQNRVEAVEANPSTGESTAAPSSPPYDPGDHNVQEAGEDVIPNMDPPSPEASEKDPVDPESEDTK